MRNGGSKEELANSILELQCKYRSPINRESQRDEKEINELNIMR